MTTAVCLKCGARKRGAFLACGQCAFVPGTPEDRAKSLALTDHFLDGTSLANVSAHIRSGREPRFDPEQLQQMIASVESGPAQEKMFEIWSRQSGRGRLKLLVGVLVVVAAVAILWFVI